MPLTDAERQELEQINARIQQLQKRQRLSYRPTEADIQYAQSKTGAGQEGLLQSALIGLGRAPIQAYKGIKQIGTELFGTESEKEKARQEAAEERKLMEKIGSPGAALAGGIAGDIATIGIPGGAAAKGLSMLGKTSSAVSKLTALGAKTIPKSALGKSIAVGAYGGALGASITPLAGEGTKLGQIGTGAAVGAVAGPALTGLVKGVGMGAKAGLKLSSRIKNKIKENKVLRDIIKDRDWTPDQLAEVNSTIQQFKDEGLEHILPPINRIIQRPTAENAFGELVTSKAVQRELLKKSDEVIDTFERLSREADEIIGISEHTANSEMIPILSKAANNIQRRARQKALDASKDFYDAAGQETVELNRVKKFLQSPVVKNHINDLKRDPVYQERLANIEASLYDSKPPVIRDAYKIVRAPENINKFNKLVKKPEAALTAKQKDFVEGFKDARQLVKDSDGVYSLSYLDLVGRTLREKADEAMFQATREGKSIDRASFLAQKSETFNKFLTGLSDNLKNAKNAYSKNIEELANLKAKNIDKLAGLNKQSVKNALNNMVNNDPEDFSDIVKLLNQDTPGLGDFVGKTWLKNQLNKLSSKSTKMDQLKNFLTKPENLKKINSVIDDKNVRALYRKMALILKHHYAPLGQSIQGGVQRVPYGGYEIRQLMFAGLDWFKSLANTPKMKYLLDSSQWPKDLVDTIKSSQSERKIAESINKLFEHIGSLPSLIGGAEIGGAASTLDLK